MCYSQHSFCHLSFLSSRFFSILEVFVAARCGEYVISTWIISVAWAIQAAGGWTFLALPPLTVAEDLENVPALASVLSELFSVTTTAATGSDHYTHVLWMGYDAI